MSEAAVAWVREKNGVAEPVRVLPVKLATILIAEQVKAAPATLGNLRW